GVPHAIACSSGTTALHLALVALGVGPGDEVIVPAMTYVASANAVSYVGADVVLVDSDPESLNVAPEAVAAALTPRTKAVIPVDLFGLPVDVAALRGALPEGVAVVEDAAEAIGARVRGHHVGASADIATFSFFGNKTITTGEGGMVTCHSPEIAARIRLYRDQGQDPDRTYFHPVLGFNYRLTNLQAAVGLAQMERVEHHLAERRRVADRYTRQLADLDHLLHIPLVPGDMAHGNWMFTVVLRQGGAGGRDRVRDHLAVDGIETRPGFTPIHRLPMHADGGAYPVAEWVGESAVSLPTYGRLTDDDLDYVVTRLRAALGA
ncbi:MAG: DegT/DnrJ/EryC1/StrS family aminotransferase, partial [Actinobacteria bacterium]|nr:DegT/DnrJ/EryC1/StrS family aminotransferase [Actinomycetota bacterium]